MDSDTNSWHWQSHSSKWTLPSLHWPLKKQEMAPWRTVSRWGTQGEHHPQPRSRQPICASPKHYASCQQLTLFSHLSMHPFRYASWLSVQFCFDKNQGSYLIVWTCHAKSIAVNALIFYASSKKWEFQVPRVMFSISSIAT